MTTEEKIDERLTALMHLVNNQTRGLETMRDQMVKVMGEFPKEMRASNLESIAANDKRYETNTRRRIALLCIEEKIKVGHACGGNEIREAFAIADKFLEVEKAGQDE